MDEHVSFRDRCPGETKSYNNIETRSKFQRARAKRLFKSIDFDIIRTFCSARVSTCAKIYGARDIIDGDVIARLSEPNILPIAARYRRGHLDFGRLYSSRQRRKEPRATLPFIAPQTQADGLEED